MVGTHVTLITSIRHMCTYMYCTRKQTQTQLTIYIWAWSGLQLEEASSIWVQILIITHWRSIGMHTRADMQHAIRFPNVASATKLNAWETWGVEGGGVDSSNLRDAHTHCYYYEALAKWHSRDMRWEIFVRAWVRVRVRPSNTYTQCNENES